MEKYTLNQYEYCEERYDGISEFELGLKEMGAKGWEAYYIERSGLFRFVYFKRKNGEIVKSQERGFSREC